MTLTAPTPATTQPAPTLAEAAAQLEQFAEWVANTTPETIARDYGDLAAMTAATLLARLQAWAARPFPDGAAHEHLHTLLHRTISDLEDANLHNIPTVHAYEGDAEAAEQVVDHVAWAADYARQAATLATEAGITL